jgi:hypothetical protein
VPGGEHPIVVDAVALLQGGQHGGEKRYIPSMGVGPAIAALATVEPVGVDKDAGGPALLLDAVRTF